MILPQDANLSWMEFSERTRGSSAEFQLRSVEPPYDQVRSEINRVVANMSSGFETMKNDGPDAVDEIYEEFQQNIADLKARIKQSN